MANYITIDSGTTNTRVSLVTDGRIADTRKFNVGAKKGMENGQLLQGALRGGIADILQANGMNEEQIECSLASGMITSEFGLVNLPHIIAPAGAKELHESLYRCSLPEISKLPFVFVRGIKTTGDELELVGPDTRPFAFQVPVMTNMDGELLEEPRTPQMQFKMQLPHPVPAHSILRRSVDLSAK